MRPIENEFIWYDNLTTNIGSSVEFYKSVAGWHGGDQNEKYPKISNDVGALCGFLDITPDAVAMGAPTHWMGYVGVDDVNYTTSTARKNGAMILKPPSDSVAGRFVLFAEPDGAVVGAFSPSIEILHQPIDKVGSFVRRELYSQTPRASLEFYQTVFDWPDGGLSNTGEVLFGAGHISQRPKSLTRNAWVYYIGVLNLDQTLQKVRDMGGNILAGTQIDSCPRAICQDCNGGIVGFEQLSE